MGVGCGVKFLSIPQGSGGALSVQAQGHHPRNSFPSLRWCGVGAVGRARPATSLSSRKWPQWSVWATRRMCRKCCTYRIHELVSLAPKNCTPHATWQRGNMFDHYHCLSGLHLTTNVCMCVFVFGLEWDGCVPQQHYAIADVSIS